MAFHICWGISALALILLAAWAGRATRSAAVGILIDNRGRDSLNHMQIVMWTLLILSSIMGVYLARLFAGESNLLAFTIPQELLILMGISVGSATVAGAAKSAKDVSGANVARAGASFAAAGGGKRTIATHFAQVFQEEEGQQADQSIDVTKFQNFIFTLLTGLAFIVWTWKQANIQGLPPLSKELLWLLGISHAGYVAGKLPARS